jgi:hypothetical protein
MTNPLDGDGVFLASEYGGANGGAQIQQAIDATPAESHAVVAVPASGPDDQASVTGDASDVWSLTESLVLPSDTTLLLLGATLRLADGVGDTMIRNASAERGDEARDHDVHVVGVGGAHVDGNAAAQHGVVVPVEEPQHQGLEYPFHRRNAIDLHRVDRFSVTGLRIGPTNAYPIAPEDVTDGYVADILYCQDGTTRNQDAINVGGPARNVVIENLRGRLADGAVTIASRGTATSHKSIYEGGDVRNIHVRNCHFEGVELVEHRWTGEGIEQTDRRVMADGERRNATGIVHTYPHHEATLERVRIANVSGSNMGPPAYRAGGEPASVETMTDPSRHDDVVVDGLVADGSPVCDLKSPIGDLTIRNARVRSEPRWGQATLLDTKGHRARSITLENCTATPIADAAAFVRIDSAVDRLRISGLDAREPSGEQKAAIDVEDGIVLTGDATVDDLTVDGARIAGTDTGIRIADGAETGRVAIEDCGFSDVGTDFEIPARAGLTVNGVGRASGTGETPDLVDWSRGTVVEYTNADTGERAVCLRLSEGWCRVGEQ